MSEPAEVPSAASSAASAIDAPDASADSTADARSGVRPMLTSATDDPWTDPWTATPTIAQSILRLVNFWNDHADGRAGFGIWISVSSSPGSIAVSKMPLKNSAGRTDPGPARPRITQTAA